MFLFPSFDFLIFPLFSWRFFAINMQTFCMPAAWEMPRNEINSFWFTVDEWMRYTFYGMSRNEVDHKQPLRVLSQPTSQLAPVPNLLARKPLVNLALWKKRAKIPLASVTDDLYTHMHLAAAWLCKILICRFTKRARSKRKSGYYVSHIKKEILPGNRSSPGCIVFFPRASLNYFPSFSLVGNRKSKDMSHNSSVCKTCRELREGERSFCEIVQKCTKWALRSFMAFCVTLIPW